MIGSFIRFLIYFLFYPETISTVAEEIITLFIVFWIFGTMICLTIFLIIGKWKLFEKAGFKGYLALIPLYSDYIFMYKICKIHYIFVIAYFLCLFNKDVMIASILIMTMCFFNLAKMFNIESKSKLIFCTVFGFIMMAIFGYKRKYVFDPNVEVSNCGYCELFIQ